MTPFWRSWLIGWSYFVMLFGLVLIGGGLPSTDLIARTIFTMIGAVDVTWTPELRFATALMGAVTLGWGITLLAAIRAAIALGDSGAPIWRTILLAMLAWYILDSFMSVATGFWMNAVSNTIILAAFAIAMFATGVLSDRHRA
jgi:hypothetical protein